MQDLTLWSLTLWSLTHLWCEEGLDHWQSIPGYGESLNGSGVQIPEPVADQFALMRFAELLKFGEASAVIEQAVTKWGGNFECAALEEWVPRFRSYCVERGAPPLSRADLLRQAGNGRSGQTLELILRMRSLELKIPPLLLAAGVALVMWPLSSLLPAMVVSSNASLALAVVMGLLGITISCAGVIAFKRARTTVNPLHPESASSLVTTGVYQLTRNPMYVGMMLGLLAWAVWLSSPIALAGPVAFIMYINRFQIEPEEKALVAKFGDEFAVYKASVRRWL